VQVAAQHPSLLFVVHGEPHPACGPLCADHYNALRSQAEALGLGRHVAFVRAFASETDLPGLVRACDVYVAAYRERATSSSGTLSMAMAAGRAVVATPFEHAREVLQQGRGVLVPFGDARALARALLGLLGDAGSRERLGRAAWEFARRTTWGEVGQQYVRLFEQLAGGSSP
jgi:glycosyltransferase involved in cell wall biosynthesis